MMIWEFTGLGSEAAAIFASLIASGSMDADELIGHIEQLETFAPPPSPTNPSNQIEPRDLLELCKGNLAEGHPERHLGSCPVPEWYQPGRPSEFDKSMRPNPKASQALILAPVSSAAQKTQPLMASKDLRSTLISCVKTPLAYSTHRSNFHTQLLYRFACAFCDSRASGSDASDSAFHGHLAVYTALHPLLDGIDEFHSIAVRALGDPCEDDASGWNVNSASAIRSMLVGIDTLLRPGDRNDAESAFHQALPLPGELGIAFIRRLGNKAVDAGISLPAFRRKLTSILDGPSISGPGARLRDWILDHPGLTEAEITDRLRDHGMSNQPILHWRNSRLDDPAAGGSPGLSLPLDDAPRNPAYNLWIVAEYAKWGADRVVSPVLQGGKATCAMCADLGIELLPYSAQGRPIRGKQRYYHNPWRCPEAPNWWVWFLSRNPGAVKQDVLEPCADPLVTYRAGCAERNIPP
jgi:hypothetical protein